MSVPRFLAPLRSGMRNRFFFSLYTVYFFSPCVIFIFRYIYGVYLKEDVNSMRNMKRCSGVQFFYCFKRCQIVRPAENIVETIKSKMIKWFKRIFCTVKKMKSSILCNKIIIVKDLSNNCKKLCFSTLLYISINSFQEYAWFDAIAAFILRAFLSDNIICAYLSVGITVVSYKILLSKCVYHCSYNLFSKLLAI